VVAIMIESDYANATSLIAAAGTVLIDYLPVSVKPLR
jgi:hypothetical protein